VPDLRERKKAKAKVLIQECALQLFAKQGYGATTVEQIAEAADVSSSTFFRYFQTKETVVLYDSLDPIIMETFRTQPLNLSLIRALRRAMKETFASLSPEKSALEMQRFELIRTIPELRTTMFDEMTRNIDLFAELIAERIHRSPDDLDVRNLAGAVIGVGMAALLQAYKRPKEVNSIDAFDEALARLEKGLELL
jgi:AcrR family transcriptional regulator